MIRPVEPVQLNPNGKWIEVLDNNFFANPEWKSAIDYLIKAGQKVNLHGVDIRIMNEEQAYWLNKLRLRRNIHIAWDLPAIDLTEKLREVTRYLKPYKIMCYVLVGFNSAIEQDMFRIETLRSFGIKPYVMPYRDFENKRTPSQYEKDLAQYVNKPMIFKSCTFAEFSPRKGFKCQTYLQLAIQISNILPAASAVTSNGKQATLHRRNAVKCTERSQPMVMYVAFTKPRVTSKR